MVYVIDNNGQPLMPTNRHGKVKHLLEDGKAKVLKNVRLLLNCCIRARIIHKALPSGRIPGVGRMAMLFILKTGG